MHQLGDNAVAMELINTALLIKPDHPEALHNLGKILKAQGQLPAAVEQFAKAIGYKPDFLKAHCNLGIALKEIGDLTAAIESYRRALSINPDCIEANYNLALAFQEEGQLGAARELYEKVIGLQPGFALAHNNLGNIFLAQENVEAAMASYRLALSMDPNCTRAYGNLAIACKDQGALAEAIDLYQKMLAIEPAFAEGHSNLLLALQYSTKHSAAEVFVEHLRFAQRFEAPLMPYWRGHHNTLDKEKRLKIGYVSGDFRNHAVAYFIEPILGQHDKSQVEVYCYYNHNQHDSITLRISQMADHWVPCKSMSDDILAERIRNDGIDILVDLSGHTGHNRLLTFAQKPAPVQITWLGYPGTTGLAAMDYRLTDEYLDAPTMTEQFHTETLLRLPCAVFHPDPLSPPVNALPAMSSGQFTLACLNNLAKINQDVIRLWARILTALPQARLLLGNVMGASARGRLLKMFAGEGIDANRLILHPKMALSDYLKLHHQIDLALDTFPYNGGTSSCHSLWMGVPVMTLAGHTTVSRVGVAVMAGAGLPEFVTSTEDEYVERTLEFARNLPRLNQVRQTARDRMNGRPGSDPEDFSRRLEHEYRSVWAQWCNSAGPKSGEILE